MPVPVWLSRGRDSAALTQAPSPLMQGCAASAETYAPSNLLLCLQVGLILIVVVLSQPVAE